MAATSATSSNSGLARPLVIFIRTVMPSTVICRQLRGPPASAPRPSARTPMVPVTRTISERSASRCAASVRTCSTCPGRPFFMVTGLTQASSAPASSAAATAWPSCSPVTSSRFVSSTSAGWPGPTGGRRGPPSDHHLGAVRQVVDFARAAAEARRGDHHVGERPERRAQGGEQRGAGGRGQLYPDVSPVGRDALRAAGRWPARGWGASRVRCARCRCRWPPATRAPRRHRAPRARRPSPRRR